jgi:hypothetical protein
VQLPEGAQRTLGFVRSVVEIVATTEDAHRVRGLIRTVAESVEISEVVSWLFGVTGEAVVKFRAMWRSMFRGMR